MTVLSWQTGSKPEIIKGGHHFYFTFLFIRPCVDACMSCKSPLLNRDSFIHEFHNLPLDIPPTSLLKALLDIACPCVIFTVNSSTATGATAVQLHACKRSAACSSDEIFNSFGPIFLSLLSVRVPRECVCVCVCAMRTRRRFPNLRRWKI